MAGSYNSLVLEHNKSDQMGLVVFTLIVGDQ